MIYIANYEMLCWTDASRWQMIDSNDFISLELENVLICYFNVAQAIANNVFIQFSGIIRCKYSMCDNFGRRLHVCYV